jgi:hypothetical protein
LRPAARSRWLTALVASVEALLDARARVVVLGRTGTVRFVIERFLASGAPDPSFGRRGVALVALGVATLCCLAPTFGFDLDFARGTDLGPSADAFYRIYGAQPSLTTREQLLSDLDRAFSSNARRLQAKERALRFAVVTLAFGLPLSAFFIGLS